MAHSKQKVVSVWFRGAKDYGLYKKLKKLAEKRRMSMSSLVVEIVEGYLAKK